MNNKETLQNYNTNLEENNETLFSILEIINELPEVSGALDITENGTYDVKSYEEANVNIDVSQYEFAPPYISFYYFGGTDLGDSLSKLNCSNLTSMYRMFDECRKLTTIDLSRFNTFKPTTMYRAFIQAESLTTLDVSPIDTSEVTTMEKCFGYCYKLESINGIENWNVGKLTSMREEFSGCKALKSLDLSKWDVSGVTTLQSTFYNCNNLMSLKLPKFTSNNTTYSSLFRSCTSLTELDLSGWDSSEITVTNDMFRDCTSLKKINLSGWNRDRMGAAGNVFYNCSSLTTLIIDADVVFPLGSTSCFTGSGIASGICTIYVPETMIDAYKADTYWGAYANQIKGMSEYTE